MKPKSPSLLLFSRQATDTEPLYAHSTDRSLSVLASPKSFAKAKRGELFCHYYALKHLPTDVESQSLRDFLKDKARESEWIVVPQLLDPKKPTLFAFDMDSTVIREEVIDEIAREQNVYEKVAEITKKAMEGGLDFDTALRERVQVFAGLPASAFDTVYSRLQKNEGVDELFARLKKRKVKIAIFSGGFTPILKRFQSENHIDRIEANDLEVVDGKFTGNVLGRIVNSQAKADYLLASCQEWGIELENTVAVGDGANDALMLGSAGLGIAFHAKTGLKQKISNWLDQYPMEVLDFVFEDGLELF